MSNTNHGQGLSPCGISGPSSFVNYICRLLDLECVCNRPWTQIEPLIVVIAHRPAMDMTHNYALVEYNVIMHWYTIVVSYIGTL